MKDANRVRKKNPSPDEIFRESGDGRKGSCRSEQKEERQMVGSSSLSLSSSRRQKMKTFLFVFLFSAPKENGY